MSRAFSYAKGARYFQVKIGNVEGEGYRFFSIALSAGGAKWTPLVAHAPSLYTIDLFALGPVFTEGKAEQLLVSLQLAGSAPTPGGGVRPGPRLGFDWLRLVRAPVDGLRVTMSDGSPPPARLESGDSLLFRVSLQQPANDAVVEWRANPEFAPLSLNGGPYVQMVRAGSGDGREWVARVTLGTGSDRFDGTAGFPIVARAVLSGGPLRETSTMVAARFE
jgi:hypothetical protein